MVKIRQANRVNFVFKCKGLLKRCHSRFRAEMPEETHDQPEGDARLGLTVLQCAVNAIDDCREFDIAFSMRLRIKKIST